MLQPFCIFAWLVIAPFNVYSEPDSRKVYEATKTKFAQYQCWKLSTCVNGRKKVCGYDDNANNLAEFEDECTLYKVNCNGVGMYFIVEMAVCEAKKTYQAQHGDKFDWQPIPLNAKTTMPRTKDVIKATTSDTPPVQETNKTDELQGGKVQLVEGKPNKYYLK